MKFRCKMTDSLAMRDFTNIIGAIAKMSKFCVLQLTPTDVCFTVFDERQPVVWAELSRDHFFSEYLVEGISSENKIYLEFDAVMLSKSMTSLKQTATSVKIKLTNKQQPCLTLEIELPSASSDSWQCVHDVPIKMVARKEWPSYNPPDIPTFHISLALPQLKHLKNVAEKMKNLSPMLSLYASNDGMLILKIETESACVSTHFPGLYVYNEIEIEEERISVTVDVKKFIMFLAWESVHPETVKCSIRQDTLVYLHLNLNDNFKIHYFLPATVL
ncbi:checkpoint protein HUS1 [Fopius arisanus]|uniref:Checkpoint protein n=2 Tax=Fopius arisanus TaxID=64838 RepID=A0A0C9QRM2_9HYME|nr:PREDICTED: checkpoint protein HUS1-like [Fopius arisanus]